MNSVVKQTKRKARKSERNVRNDRPAVVALARFRRELDRRVSQALAFGPVLVVRCKRPALVLMSLDDYYAMINVAGRESLQGDRP